MWEPLLTKISALIALGIAAILIVLFPFVDKKNNHISWICLFVGGLITVLLIYWIVSDDFYRGEFIGI